LSFGEASSRGVKVVWIVDDLTCGQRCKVCLDAETMMTVWKVRERPNFSGDGEGGDALVHDPRFPNWPQRFKSPQEAYLYATSWMEPGDILEKLAPDEGSPD
jgi:hypothetical protein